MKKLIYLPLISLAFACGNNDSKQESAAEVIQPAPAFDISNLDKTVEPCTDFYQYAIGGWLKANPIPSTESRWSSFNTVIDSNNEKLRAILDEYSTQKTTQGSMEQMIGDYYLSLMDSSKAEKIGIQPIKDQLMSVENANTLNDLIRIGAEFSQIGIRSWYSLYIGQDDKNSAEYITHISQGGLGLPDQAYYTKTDEKSKEIQEAYKYHLIKIFYLLGDEDAEVNAPKVYELERRMAEVSMTRVERRDPDKTYNKNNRAQLQKLTSNINWADHFKIIGLKEVNDVIVSQPDYLKSLNNLLSEYSVADWKLYLKWKIVDTYASNLNQDFVDADFDFYSRTLSGTKEMKPRWKRALNKVNGGIGELLGKAFVEKHFTKESKQNLANMVENLRTVFRERINELEWMSEETKINALQTLDAFNMKLGYPDKWKDYSSLNIMPDNAVQNIMNARMFSFNEMVKKLGQPVDKDEWYMTPQTVNAYYSSSQNEIVFPAGILQPPFYDANADDAINYGGIGAVIGHEFTHGFDDQGSKYDYEGNLTNWWTETDRTQFDERANFVVQQFDSFEPLEGLFVNGKLTLGENIADLGGATLAYHALETELGSKGIPEPIDGFDYKQRFFLGWAQVWHMNMTEEELRKRIATDSHSPGEYRVIGPLANMPEFADAFGCVEADPMVNSDSVKAVIW
jgi:putative endopeptidase